MAKQLFLEKLNYDKNSQKTETERSILKHLGTRSGKTKWLQPLYHTLASNGYALTKNIFSNESGEAFTRIWEEIQKRYSTVVTVQFMEEKVLKYWEDLEKQSGLKMVENTLKWSKVLIAAWDTNERHFLKEDPKEKFDVMIKKYCLLTIIPIVTETWDILGLPHDFQNTILEEPEIFFKKNIEPLIN